MKKINLRGISEILSEEELKNVLGGSGVTCSTGACNKITLCYYGDIEGSCRPDDNNKSCTCQKRSI